MASYDEDLGKAGTLSLPITLIVLVLTFGSLVAAGIPLLLALTAVFATFGLVALSSVLLPVAMQAPAMVLLIGLAVGVDYSLFYLKRERQERAAGRSERAALEVAAATSGRSVLISGLTVMVAMAAMFLTGDSTFASLALATILVVAVAVLGSLTVLPALLSRLGDNVARARVPFVVASVATTAKGGSGARSSTASFVGRSLSVIVAGGLLVALALPAMQLRLAAEGPESFPKSIEVDQDLRPDAAGVPGLCTARERRRRGIERADARRCRRRSGSSSDGRSQAAALSEPITIDVNEAGTVANITVPIAGNGTDAASNASFRMLRDEVVPETLGALPDTQAGSPADGRVERPGGRTEVEPASGGRLRPPLCLRPDAGRVPLDRGRGQGDPAQPPLGRGSLRRARARLPARLRQGAARGAAPRMGSTRWCRFSCS